MDELPSENRYLRQIALHDLGEDGQKRIAASRIDLASAIASLNKSLLAIC